MPTNIAEVDALDACYELYRLIGKSLQNHNVNT
jgi:hypothetical protein